jgi:hypothetical protein
MDEKDRPEHVIVAVMTDGQENASHEFTKDMVKELVEHQTEVYKWTFMFLAADVNAFAGARTYGFVAAQSVLYTGTGDGTQSAYSALSSNICRSRGGNIKGFTGDERSILSGGSSNSGVCGPGSSSCGCSSGKSIGKAKVKKVASPKKH